MSDIISWLAERGTTIVIRVAIFLVDSDCSILVKRAVLRLTG
jgi:hypothetical protein